MICIFFCLKEIVIIYIFLGGGGVFGERNGKIKREKMKDISLIEM